MSYICIWKSEKAVKEFSKELAEAEFQTFHFFRITHYKPQEAEPILGTASFFITFLDFFLILFD